MRSLGYSTKLGREKLMAVLGGFVLGDGFADGFCWSGFLLWVLWEWVSAVGFRWWLFESGFYLLFGCYCFLQFFEFQIRLHPNKGVNFQIFLFVLIFYSI